MYINTLYIDPKLNRPFLQFNYRAAKQHQAQQEAAEHYFDELTRPPGLQRSFKSKSLELFGNAYHPSKYSRDPETMNHEEHLMSIGIMSASFHPAWQDGSFSREASASPPYGVTHC